MSTPARERMIEVDALRGSALIGVCVMNYHGYLVQAGASWPPRNFLERQFDPWSGPLSTRFAAVFVAVAGISISLLTRRARASGDRLQRSAARITLVRRGVLLFAFGYFFNWVWDGTILFFYGAFFLVGALLFTLRSRWLVVIGAVAAITAAATRWWAVDQRAHGHNPVWILQAPATDQHSPKEMLLDVFLRGTHPLFPWLAFLCMGIILGRLMPFSRSEMHRPRLAATGALLLSVGYLLHEVLPWQADLRSTDPFDRGLLYTATAAGSTLIAVSALGWLFERTRGSAPTRALAAAGRTTLTLYVGHALVFNLLVHEWHLVHPAGLGTALAFAAGYWVVAVALATAIHRRFELGPLEWCYRRFS